MLNSKALGGILLLMGTSIGAGMLALPLVLATTGFYTSVGLLTFCWFVMYLGARYILEVNLAFAPGSNLVSMAKARLGWPGQCLAWISCLSLMYSLLSGYISGGSDVFKNLSQQAGVVLSDTWCTVIFTLFFGLIVYAGIRTVDYVNRGLMFGKLGIFVLVLGLMLPSLHMTQLHGASATTLTSGVMILITSFGFASIVPSLRYYFQDDISLLKRVLWWGSLTPLFCYVMWIAVIKGVLPVEGAYSLATISQSNHPLGGLINSLQVTIGAGWIDRLFSAFTVICLLTAFLGVSLGLFDFLSDGAKLNKKGRQGFLVFALTFMPPMCLVILNPGLYMHALQYAGRCCVLLLLILPALMMLRSNKKTYGAVMGGRVGAVVVLGVSGVLLYLYP